MRIIDCNGCEFGYELVMVIPYAYYNKQNNIPVKVITSKKMEPYYYFLNNDEVEYRYTERSGLWPKGTIMKQLHVPELPDVGWTPPPYSDIYTGNNIMGIDSTKDIILVSLFLFQAQLI